MKNIKNVAIFSVILIFGISSVAQGKPSNTAWIKSSGESCYIVCNRTNGKAFQSGMYNGSPMYICSANVGNRGYRAGFNNASKPQVCFVAYGHKKSEEPHNFKCLCYR